MVVVAAGDRTEKAEKVAKPGAQTGKLARAAKSVSLARVIAKDGVKNALRVGSPVVATNERTLPSNPLNRSSKAPRPIVALTGRAPVVRRGETVASVVSLRPTRKPQQYSPRMPSSRKPARAPSLEQARPSESTHCRPRRLSIHKPHCLQAQTV